MIRFALFTTACLPLLFSFPPKAEPRAGGPKHEVFVEAPTKLSPGARAGLRVTVFRSTGVLRLEPVADAQVDVLLIKEKETNVFSGRTPKDGSIGATFTVPELADGDYTMEVRTKSADGSHVSKSSVRVRREHRILLVTDKPLYQPSQTMHLRALALGEMTLKPAAGAEVLFEVEDPKGNKVFKRRIAANDFGVASCDFDLADEVNMGDYRISAFVGTSKTEKAVTVKKYVLPKFKVAAKSDKSFYLPKETVKGTVQVDYFFGKPVKDGSVRVKASTFDVQFREFADVTTKTDANGRATFEVTLPDYFIGHPLEKGNAFVQLEIAVTDTAEHEERVTKTFSVANSLIQLHAVPESGKLVPGIENVVYVLATAPDGSAVQAEVALQGAGVDAKGTTNESGFAAIKITPSTKSLRAGGRGDAIFDVVLRAKDKQGNEASKGLELSSEYGRDQMLMRLDKAIYTAGEKVEVDLFATFDRGMVFLDAVQSGQLALASTCELASGRAKYTMTLPAELFGSLEIHAYKIMADGEIVRDTRVVYVQPPQELKIQIDGGKETYLPAEEMKLTFRVTDRGNQPVQAALGVLVVDEAVYALQEMQPGLEKVFFTLAQELQEPRFGIKVGTSMPELISQGETKKQEVAKILMAPAAPAAPRWSENTYAAKLAQFDQTLAVIYQAMYYHIVQDKVKFYVGDSSGRRFKPDLLEELLRAKSYKLPKDHLVDPWGNKVTLDDLARLSSSFTFEHWAKIMSLQNLTTIWQHLVRFVVENDALANGVLRADLLDALVAKGLPKEAAADCFGDRFVPERLAKEDDAFSPENIAILTREQRRATIFTFLVAEYGKVTDQVLSAKPFARKVEGGTWTLADLGREHPAFTADNLARIANVRRRQAVYEALVANVRSKGWDAVTVFDKSWKWKEGLLTNEQLTDVTGKVRTLDEIAAEDKQFSPETFLAGLHSSARQKIDNVVCNKFHSGNRALPEDPVAKLIEEKHLTREEVLDAWGTVLKLVPVGDKRPGQLGCGLLSGRFTILSAGPDRKFDTADDVNVGAGHAVGQYQPNYANCVFYNALPTRNVMTHGPGDESEERLGMLTKELGDSKRQFGGSGGGDDRLRSNPSKPKAEKKSMDKDMPETESEDSGGPIRVREYFPETLVWQPCLITDEKGVATLPVKLADSITTWRVTATASSRGGLLGSTTGQIVVFQDFFVDIDLPVALTQNDSVSIPIAVYNYLKRDQTVTLTLKNEDWFELLDEPKKEIALKPDQVKAVYFRLKVKRIGHQALTVEARGEKCGDAIKRTVEIVPDGKMFEAVINDRLSPRIVREIEIPMKSIDDSYKIFVKVHPGIFSQMMEGVEGMLGMPHG